MPMFEYVCAECKFKKTHFDAPGKENVKRSCPNCESKLYSKKISGFSLNVEYSTVEDINEYKINPGVQETYEQIGREALDHDTKTLDNLYGKDKVEKTFYTSDD